MADVLNVVITGAAGQIAYSLLYSVAKGDVFGPSQKVNLKLLDIAPMMGVLEGVAMELNDCALPLINEIVCTDEPNVAFKDADVGMLVGAMPRKEGMERKDLLKANVKIFESMGKAIDEHAKKSIKVVVVGNPANTNAYICAHYAPSIPKTNFSALTRLDQNRAQSQIAARLGISCDDVRNCIIWGNHSSTQFPDVKEARVTINGKEMPVYEAVKDDSWLKGDFIKTVQTRGAAVIKARKLSSAMSAAKAIVDHMRDWWHGTGDRIVSMAVVSDGSYEIESGLVYSYPVTIGTDRNYKIVQGLSIDDFQKEKMTVTQKELVEERDHAIQICQEQEKK